MKVVLMAGGLGTRLRPMTNEVPKPMLHVGNKPILQTIINQFSRSGFKDFIISVNYKKEKIINHFGDGSKFGVNIEYVEDVKRMGTAGALTLMKDKLDCPFFVMNGDILTNINFEKMYNHFFDNNSRPTMAVKKHKVEIPYGVVNIKDGLIKSFKEKPTYEFYINAGIYVLHPGHLGLIPEHFHYKFDMTDLFEIIEYKTSYLIEDRWIDIGNIEDYHKANEEYYLFFH